MNTVFPIPSPSSFLQAGFYLLAIGVALSLPVATWRASRSKNDTTFTLVLVLAWLTFTGLISTWDGFRNFQPPPPFPIVAFSGIVGAISLAFSPIGTRMLGGLSLAGLVLFQAFRFPLELLMHRAYTEGLMPAQMSYDGRNFDILTGISAVILGLLLWRGNVSKSLVWAWNILGIVLLVNIVVVAILSLPAPWRQFLNDPPNVWVLEVPFVWLPTILVTAAVFGHCMVARKLCANTISSSQ